MQTNICVLRSAAVVIILPRAIAVAIQVWVGNATSVLSVASSFTSSHDALITTIAYTDIGVAGGFVSIHLPNSMILQAGGTFVVTYAPQVFTQYPYRIGPLPVHVRADSEHLQFSGFNSLLWPCSATPTPGAAGVTYLGTLLSSNSGVPGSWSIGTGTAAYGCLRLQVRDLRLVALKLAQTKPPR